MKITDIRWLVPVDQYGNDYDKKNVYRMPAPNGGFIDEPADTRFFECRLDADFGDGHSAYATMRVSPEMLTASVSRSAIESCVRRELIHKLGVLAEKKLNEIWRTPCSTVH